ncbi:MAG: type III-A CRISPR-associated protein Csm2 [SAR324 cluster bacterium]|nr:type III-A CRISPR-associated protein Csm2 [SAR324 cluster bacterium]|tara:strand:+ start:206 stop:628 length:423 start_codon:yes stop_codon:yes gene_type:complete
MSFYTDEGKTQIKNGLLDKEAEGWSQKLVRMQERGNRIDSRNSISSSQLRRFFNEFRSLEKRVNSAPVFETVLPLIKMVKSKVSYAAGRGTGQQIPESFKSFLNQNIDRIQDKQDFNAFMLHFEAVVGYCYGVPGFAKSN